ncbi:MAG: TVP38/TMEM64 family protein [Acidobacteria bacterium]|nr:TVP38/TMEM64 family protein [Acidobacteriota bacterium]
MSEPLIEARPKASRGTLVVKAVAGVAGLVGLLYFGRLVGAYIPQFAEWVDGLGVWGPIVFALGYAVATVGFIPGSLLTLAAGAIFGLAKGTVTVFFGATLGSALAFLIARYLARSAVERRIAGSAKFAAIDRAVAKEGLKIVTLLRLAPIFPFNLMNYGLGLTKVSFRDYMIASLGMIPGTFLYVYYGKALGSLAAVAGGVEVERGVGGWITFGVGLAAALAVALYVARIAKRALEQEVEDV